ncbi:type I pantothenate kinase [Arsenophonus symbiont of Ornithomya chloropus]|uniref:type I pantothenate kinase n=1 Tax=Arsenophonus symbiont of Ornithomya chloropus TaxID=634121 RepID=UPI0032B2DED3
MKKKEKFSIETYLEFNPENWMIFCKTLPIQLSKKNKESLQFQGINYKIQMKEINTIYIPITELLNFYISLNLHQKSFLKKTSDTTNMNKIPYVIGIVGSVAVGKSTTANLLKKLLSSEPLHHRVELITTDSFLYPNKTLQDKGLMHKKGFPQSYDMHKLIKFITEIKSGITKVTAPIYSHFVYDIIPNKKKIIHRPDVLILEGLNILQNNTNCRHKSNHLLVSDFLDFSIYVDAPENLLRKWYIKRFLRFCQKAFSNSKSYFYNYSRLNKKEITKIAQAIWEKINKINLEKNIIPTKEKAELIITKSYNHSIIKIQLKK